MGSALEEKLCSKSYFEVHNFEGLEDLNQSIQSLRKFIQSNGPKVSYVFDDISCLKKKRHEPSLFSFFRALNSQLQELGAVSYWPLLRGSVVKDTVAKFSGIAQLLVSVERTDTGTCIHPLKVPSEKFYQMLKPYIFDFESLGLEKKDASSILLNLLMQKVGEVNRLKQELQKYEGVKDTLESHAVAMEEAK